ncbi:MAG: cell division protein FtsA [Spirochaetia bacterium]|nr:cell division protein FtsA [Spirochaetia bacterium]
MVSEKIVVGLDIGTSKIAAVIGEYEYSEDGRPRLEIIGAGTAVSDGVRNGAVINIAKTVDGITKAVEAAQQMCGRTVTEVICGLGGDHIEGCNSKGNIAIGAGTRRKTREVTPEDKARAIESASAVPGSEDRITVALDDREYIVDGHGNIKDPVNMTCTRLEAEVHIITGSRTVVNNIESCGEKAGYHVVRSFPNIKVLTRSVLTPEEKNSCVMIIDMGAGTTDVMIADECNACFTKVIPMGGNDITKDLASVLKLPVEIAEKIKINQVVCHESSLGAGNQQIVLPISTNGWADRVIYTQDACEIAKARVWEIFNEIYKSLKDTGYYKMITSGIVLTGGCADFPGICDFASEFFQLPVRVGKPLGLSGKAVAFAEPRYAAAVGLARLKFELDLASGENDAGRRHKTGFISRGEKGKNISRVGSWFKDIF